MTQQRAAAQSLYPHLPSAAREPVGQREQPRLAEALYPSLAPKPKPELSRYRESADMRSLVERADAAFWVELKLAKMGLIRRR
jgi:hypothetical protein